MADSSFKRACRARNDPCWICGEPISYNAGNKSRWHFTKDHYMPVSTHPHMSYIVENWRAAHALCNSRRGNRLPDETVWIGSKEHGHWARPQRPAKVVKPSKAKLKREREKKRKAESEAQIKKFLKQRELMCRCGEYRCTYHNEDAPKKRKRKTPQELEANGGPLHLYQGPFIQERSVL